jgi:plasmid replication initiation protein
MVLIHYMLQDRNSMSSPLQVYKANNLINANFRLTVPENRVILYCIAMIKHAPGLVVSDQELYTVTAKGFAEECAISMSAAYKELKQATDMLFEREISFDNGKRVRKTRWIQTADYLESEGRVDIRFAKDMLPYLVDLQKYTKYNLRSAIRLPTFPSQRLYEMIVRQRFDGRGVLMLNLADFRAALVVEKDKYPLYADFRKRVITPAINDINNHTEIKIASFKPKRDGRKIVSIAIYYEEIPNFTAQQIQEDLFFETSHESANMAKKASKRPITEAQVLASARPGESYDDVKYRLTKERDALIGELV